MIGRSNFEEIRKLLISSTSVLRWLHLNNVFDTANVSSLIYVCLKTECPQQSFIYQKADNVIQWQYGTVESMIIKIPQLSENDSYKVVFAAEDDLSILTHLRKFPTFEESFIMWRGEEIGKKDSVILSSHVSGSIPILTGENVHRYEMPIPSRWIPKENVHKDTALYKRPKLLIRQLGDKINATIDTAGMVSTQSVYSLVPLNKDGSEESLLFYLGLLNSSLFDFIYRLTSGDKQLFKRIVLENIKALPLPDKVSCENIRLLASYAQQCLHADEILAPTEEAIDNLVFSLYRLPPNMIEIVKGGVS